MIRVLRNLRLAVGVTRNHLTDDPFVLLLQLSRRLPARVVGALSAAVVRFTHRDSAALPVLLATLMKGDDGDEIIYFIWH